MKPEPTFPAVTITAQTREANSTIYYTLDGTDPRLPGGGVAPGVFSNLNQVTLTVTNNVRVFARNRNASHANPTSAPRPAGTRAWIEGPPITAVSAGARRPRAARAAPTPGRGRG